MSAETKQQEAGSSSPLPASSVGSSPVLVGNIGIPRAAVGLSSSMTLPNRGAQLLSMDNWKMNDTKEKKIDDIAAQIGKIEKEYKCTHKNFTGTMYAGPNAVAFLGRVFVLEWSVLLRWEDVCHVHKLRQGGIRIVARPSSKFQRELASYDFDQFSHHQEQVWASLVSLHNSIITTPPGTRNVNRDRTSSESSLTDKFPFRRLNSDPLAMLHNVLLQPTKSVEEAEIGEKGADLGEDDTDGACLNPVVLSPSSLSDNNKEDELERTESDPEEKKNPTNSDLKRQWSQLVEDRNSYSDCIVERLELPCDLDTFITLFLEDEAKYSIPNFMKRIGDAQISCSKWKISPAKKSVNSSVDVGVASQENDSESKGRIIEYTHPVNAPMAPPMARARKEQTFRQFGEHGLELVTKTYVDDVPMTDCFYVADVIRVEPNYDDDSDDGNSRKVILSMHFDIRFIKNTMFQGIITRTTKKEFEKFLTSLGEFMLSKMNDESNGQADSKQDVLPPEVLVPSPPPASTTPFTPVNIAILSILAIVLVLQLWIIGEIRSVRHEMRHMMIQQHAKPVMIPEESCPLISETKVDVQEQERWKTHLGSQERDSDSLVKEKIDLALLNT